jgi:hypothetical protein
VALLNLEASHEVEGEHTEQLHAHLEGFDLHANVAVRAGERVRLDHLCRYVLRPPVAQDALELTPEGKVLLRLRRPWRDGTRAIRFEPTELLEKLDGGGTSPGVTSASNRKHSSSRLTQTRDQRQRNHFEAEKPRLSGSAVARSSRAEAKGTRKASQLSPY